MPRSTSRLAVKLKTKPRPTLGLALSGPGNRSSFYIGFLEILQEHEIPIDYIAACSGGSLIAAAFACGTLAQFKEKVLSLNKETLKTYFTRSKGKGGLFSMDLLEQEIRNFTKGLRFEEVRPLMGFVAVDIESGEKVLLCMGDIAKAARISCTVPGIFEPEKWGGKTLVDGGLLTIMPADILKGADIDVKIGINIRGTKHIFTEPQLTAKKILNFLKRLFFVEELESFFDNIFRLDDGFGAEQKPGFFQVLGKSLDVAIKANQQPDNGETILDLIISPDLPKMRSTEFSQEAVKYFYEQGRKSAEENVSKITALIKSKQKALEKI
jgi:predicted acylesterase/phospholipase RssA